MSTTTLAAPFDAGRLSRSTERPLEAAAEFSIGLRSMPYLADHGFQDMAVLPGAFYIELALHVERELGGRVPGGVRSVTFDNPVILPAEDILLRLEVKERGAGRVEYAFYEGGAGRQPAARLEIERAPAPRADAVAPAIAQFQAQAQVAIGAGGFYGKLRENGNQYGPGFQKLSAIWRSGGEALGRLSVTPEDRELGPTGMHPGLLDAMAQLLAAFSLERGSTFVLRSIDRIDVLDLDFPATLWGHAVLRDAGEADGKRQVGDVRVFDSSGKCYLELSGIAFAFLERANLERNPQICQDQAAPAQEPAASLVIASNFTAEPVEDVLKFWGDHFGLPLRLEFTPYNQVLQQLLDKGSALRRNRDGCNLVLLNLEDWAAGNPVGLPAPDRDLADRWLGERARHVLPNGLEIAHLHRYETEYLYKEIFVDECYARHGIRLEDGATVVDIGANIGLFSLWVASRCRNPWIYACEPAPVVFDLLKANCETYGSDAGGPSILALNLGVADRPKIAALTFYEKSSVFSSFHADEAEDRAAIQAIVRNMLAGATSAADEAVEEYVEELTADRLRRRIHECRMTTVSELIREHRIGRIDLLKIDAEKSELDILAGIDDSDWPKIDQIVIEIHDRTRETVRRVEDLLAARGFRCALEHEKLLERSGLYNLYATRHAAHESAAREGPSRARRALERNVDDFCAALASCMGQAAAPLVLSVCPRSPAARADAALNAALDAAERALLARAGALANVHTIGSDAPLKRYPVRDYYDPHGRELGHIPYTPEGYAAIGTALVRTLFGLKRKPYKVIVLDCDNTLWKGVCGEDGALGVEVSAPYRRLQAFLVERMRAGMLLTLCSKNNERDVLEVFDRRSDMVLKREHLAAHRVNWTSKSGNVRALARELNLGLDSFIFIDDNPLECAEVRAGCPGVLALQLPSDGESFDAFLEHVWAFDGANGAPATEEDRNRTRLYQEDAARRRLREQNFSLRDFIRELELRIEIADATEDQIGRISQLTWRTNQFNFTTIRRSEDEVRALLRNGDAACLAVRVADRFGDYGLVGVAIYERRADRYHVDTLLLSCRVLGRGVEHAILAHLGARAAREGRTLVELAFRTTEKNLPALTFAESVGGRLGRRTELSWVFPAERLAGLQYDPEDAEGAAGSPGDDATADAEGTPQAAAPRAAARFDECARPDALERIAAGLHRIDLLVQAIEAYRLRAEPRAAAADAAPGDTLESRLLGIWRKVLGRPRIGPNDNFFDAGGTSLRAVQVIATIRKELNRNLSIVSLFECPTVKLLAARLDAPAADPGAAQAAGAALRGRQRRTSVVRRHAS